MATRNNSLSYTKNLAKSLGYLTFDTLVQGTVFEETVSDNKDTVKEIYQGIKDFAKNPKAAVQNASVFQEYSPILKDGFKNLMDDIKSGNLYNKDREEQAMMDTIMGDSGFDFNFDDFEDASFDDFDMGSSEEPITDGSSALAAKAQSIATCQNIKAMDIVGKTTAKAINTTTARSAQYIVQAQQASTQLIMKQQAKMFNQVSVGLAGVNQSLGALVSLGEPLTAHMQNSMKFYTETSQKLDKVVTLLDSMNKYMAPAETSGSRKTYKGIDSFLTASGAISLSGMKEMLGRNFGRAVDSSVLGMLLNFQIGDDGKGLWKQMAANPIGTILKFALPSLLPKAFKDSIEHLGKTLAGFNVALIQKLKNMSGSPVKDFIGQLFDYDNTFNPKADPSKYNKGRVAFDGKTRLAIIKVIPTYLSKILAAITGGFETRFNYEKGIFQNRQQIKAEGREAMRTAARTIGDEFADLDEIREIFKDKKGDYLSRREAEAIQKDMDKYFANAIKTNMLIDPNKKYSTDEIKKFGFDDPARFKNIQKLYKYYMGTNNGYRIMQLNAEVNRQRLALSEKYANMDPDDILMSEFDAGFEDSIFGGTRGGIGIGGSRADQQKANRMYNRNTLNKTLVNFSKTDFDKRVNKLKEHGVSAKEITKIKKEYERIFGKGSLSTNIERRNFIEMLDEKMGYGEHYDDGLEGGEVTGIRAVGRKVKKVIESPLSLVTNILNKADKTLFEIIYGKVDKEGNVIEDANHESVLSLMFVQMKDMFTTFKDWMKDNIFDPFKNKIVDPIKKWFVDKGGVKGILSNLLGFDVDVALQMAKEKARDVARKVGQNFKTVGEWSWNKLKGLKDEFASGSRIVSARRYYGRGSLDPNYDDKDIIQAFKDLDTKNMSYKEAAKKNHIEEADLIRLYNQYGGRELGDGRAVVGAHVAQVRAGTRDFFNNKNAFGYRTIQEFTGGISSFFHSIMPDNKDADKVAEETKKVVKTSLKALNVDMDGAITGALMGGGLSILSGGVVSPLLAASIGGAAGLIIKSKSMQTMLFGEEDSEGNRSGGLLPEKLTEFLTKKLPSVAGFSIAGGLAGLLPIMPGGPIGGMFIGAGVGFLKHSKAVQNFLFGDDKKGTLGILGSQEDKKAKIDWIKKMAPRAAAGAAIGAIAGPFGFVGNIMAGAALGFVSDTELFKRAMFGEEKEIGKDEDGNPIMGREGGLTGIIRKEIISPLGRALNPIATELKHNAKSIIHNTSRMIAWGLSKAFASVTRPMWDKLGTFVLGPMAKILGTTFSGVAKIATSPFKLIGAYGDHLKRKQIKGGYATYMSAKERHNFMVQRGWKESGFSDADASMMTMDEGALSETLGDINTLLSLNERYGAQNNYNRSAVKVGNIVRKLAKGKEGYRLAKEAQEMAAAGKNEMDIINYLQSNGVNVTGEAANQIRDAISRVSRAGDRLNASNSAKEAAMARLRERYNLGENFDLSDRNLLRLQETTQHEIGLRNAKGDKRVDAVNKSVQETLLEVSTAHSKKMEQRMIDIINAIYSLGKGKKKKHIPGGTDDVPAETGTEEAASGGESEEEIGAVNGFYGVFNRRNIFQAMHSMWNPLHDMDVPSTEAAIQYYEAVTLGHGTINDVQYSAEEAGVSSIDQLAGRVRKIGDRDDLISVTDKNYRTVNLHKIGDVWYFATGHNIMAVLQSTGIGKAISGIKSGLKAVGRGIKTAYQFIRRLWNPLYNFDPTFAQRILEQYDDYRAGKSESDEWTQYIKVDYENFPDGDVINLHDDAGHSVNLRMSGDTWIYATPMWLSIHRGLHRAGNLIKTAFKSTVNFVKNFGKNTKRLYGAIRRKINPFYDFSAEEMEVINNDIEMISSEGGSGEYLKAVKGAEGIYKVAAPEHPIFWVDLRSGTPKYVSPHKVKLLKTKAVVTGIGGKVKNLVKGIGSAFRNVIGGSGSGLIPASRYYRGRGFAEKASKAWNGVKSVFGGLFSGDGGSSDEEGGKQGILESILSPNVPDSTGGLSGWLTKINSSKFNPKNFLSGSTDFSLGTKEAREQFRREQANLNIFRETTFVAQQISQKMDVLLDGLMGISVGKGGGGRKGGILGTLAKAAIGSAAIWGGIYALASGKLNKETENMFNSSDMGNEAPGSGGMSNLYVTDEETGEKVSLATKDGNSVVTVDENGNLAYETTDGGTIPITDEEGNPVNVEAINNGKQGTDSKIANKFIRDLLLGRKTPLGLALKLESKIGLTGIAKRFIPKPIRNALSNSRLGKWISNTAQNAQSALYGATRRNWMSKLDDLPGVNKFTNWLSGTKVGSWLEEKGLKNITHLNSKEAVDNTYKRFQKVFGNEANIKWMEFQEDGAEMFAKNNAEKIGKDYDSLFEYVKYIDEADEYTLKVTEQAMEKAEKELAKQTELKWYQKAINKISGKSGSEVAEKGAKEAVEEGVEGGFKQKFADFMNKYIYKGSAEVTAKGAKEAAEEGTEKVLKNTAEEAFEKAAKEAAQEGVEKVGKKTIAKNVQDAVAAVFKKCSGYDLVLNVFKDPDTVTSVGKQFGKELGEEIGEQAAKGSGYFKKAVAKVPILGWILTVGFAAWEFEEAWNSAEITLGVEDPTAFERFCCAILPGVAEFVATATGYPVDWVPYTWFIEKLLNFGEKIGFLPKNLQQRRDTMNKHIAEENAKRADKGQGELTRSDYVKGVLGKTTLGDDVGAFVQRDLEKQKNRTLDTEWEHAQYLDKLRKQQISRAEYEAKKRTTTWKDPGDNGEDYGVGNTSSLNHLYSNIDNKEALLKKYPDWNTDLAFAYNQMYNPKYWDEETGSYNGPANGYEGKGSLLKLIRGKGGAFVSQISSGLSNLPFGGTTFGQNGCAPAVASMLTGMPVGATAGYAMGGGYTNSGGTSADYFGNLFAQNGIPSEYVFTGAGSAQDYLESRIASGSPTVLLGQDYGNTSKANSPFGPGNHYVLATGEDSRGNIIVQDPEASRPNITYNRSILNSVKLGIPTGGASRIHRAAKHIGRRVKRALTMRGGSTFTIGENHKQIWTFLKKNGLSDAGAAGLMGCWQAESSNRPDRIEGDYVQSFPGFAAVASNSAELDAWTQKLFSMYAKKGLKINQSAYVGDDGHYYPGFGLAQWTGGRGYRLLAWCREKDYDWKQLLSQLEYALYELQGSYSGVYSSLKSANDVMEACRTAYNKYEGGKRQDWLQARQNYAISIYNALSGKTYSMPTSTGTSSDNIYGAVQTEGGPISGAAMSGIDSGTETGEEEGSIGTFGTLFNDLFAGALGKLGEMFGIVSSKKKSGATPSATSGNYDYSGNVISPDGSYSTTLKPLPELNSSHPINFVNAALSQKGYVETPNNMTDFGAYTGANGAPWCASFVSWAMNKAFKGNREKAARALYGEPTASVGTLWDRFRSNNAMSSTPAVGDVVIYKNNGSSHTGIVYGVDGNTVNTVEGNTSGDSSFSANGGMVWVKSFDYTKKGNLTGFGRPNWAAIPEEDLNQKGFADSRTSGSYGLTGAAIEAGRQRAGLIPTGTLATTDPRYQAAGSGLVRYNVAQAGYNTVNRKHRRAHSVFGGSSGIVNLSRVSDSSKARYISALKQYAGSGSIDNDTMITLVKGIISLLSNVSANSDKISEVVKYLQIQSENTANNMNLNVSTAANDMNVEDTDSTIREMQKLLQDLAAGA